MTDVEQIELYAGVNPAGQPVLEKVEVTLREDGNHQLLKSPAFVRGLARGDVVKVDSETAKHSVVRRSGHLCIRVIAKNDIQVIADELTPVIEKLGGQLDLSTPRLLVYSIHVSCGFKVIEQALNDHVDESNESIWMYGNVYDEADGITPLKWWEAILKEN